MKIIDFEVHMEIICLWMKSLLATYKN